MSGVLPMIDTNIQDASITRRTVMDKYVLLNYNSPFVKQNLVSHSGLVAITFEDKSSPVIPRTPTQVVPPCSGVLTI